MTAGVHITDLLGVEHPLGNAGMAGIAGPELCAAVAEAGGIGSLALGGADVETALARVARVKELTASPFSVNFIGWILAHDSAPLDAVIAAGVPSVTLSFADPSPYVERIHGSGALVLAQIQTLAGATVATGAGVDCIIAQGNEAGGHTGLIPLMPLLPQVVDAVGDTLVLAAGGIGDGRGLAAVLMLGASGALMGTRFLAANEAMTQWPKLASLAIASSADDTVWSTAIDIADGGGASRWPEGIGGRSIRTPFLDQWASREAALALATTGAIDAPEKRVGDSRDPTPAYAGPITGMVTKRENAASIITATIAQASVVLKDRRTALDG